VHLLDEPLVRGDVRVVPEPALDEAACVGGGVDLDLLGADDAQPPSALTPRMTAWAVGSRWPMPLQCGTWKKRLRAVTGPSGTGSKRTS
jgi:hypothetical protein